jgi:hypothetical protein
LTTLTTTFGQELNEEAKTLQNASEKEMTDFYDCIENRAIQKYGSMDNTAHITFINEQSSALFEYFELRDSLINDPVSAAMMLKVAWKWGAREGGICNVDWTAALKDIRANLSVEKE